MSESDPPADLDAEFDRWHKVILQADVTAAPRDEVEHASARMVEIAWQTGDRGMWAFIFARAHDFIRNGVAPPMGFLRGINDAFTRFRGGVKSLDDAFGLNRSSRGKPVRWHDREIARTRASVVAHFVESGDSLEIALEKAAALKSLGGVSESQMKRDYLKYRRRR